MPKGKIVTSLARYLPSFLKQPARWMLHCLSFNRYVQVSYSQEGEDLILSRLFESRESGFYVDVGAHHPIRFSNTYRFYRRGWRGINIDAMPGSMDAFHRVRQRDINLEIPVLKERGVLSYYQFNEPALNSFSPELSKERNGKNGCRVVNVVELEGLPLRDILSEHLPSPEQRIDFMSIDVEGLDLAVLESSDWERFRPSAVLVEIERSSLHTISNDPIYRYLSGHGYHIFAKAFQTVFFLSEEYLSERGLLPSRPESDKTQIV